MKKEFTPPQRVTNFFFKVKGWDWTEKRYKPIYSRWIGVVNRDLMPMAENNVHLIRDKILEVQKWADQLGLSWTLDTVVKRWLEDNSIEKKPYTPDGDLLKQIRGKWIIELWDGRLVNYNGNNKDIIWK